MPQDAQGPGSVNGGSPGWQHARQSITSGALWISGRPPRQTEASAGHTTHSPASVVKDSAPHVALEVPWFTPYQESVNLRDEQSSVPTGTVPPRRDLRCGELASAGARPRAATTLPRIDSSAAAMRCFRSKSAGLAAVDVAVKRATFSSGFFAAVFYFYRTK